MEGVPGHVAAGKLLNRHSGNHRAAWDSLDIFSLDTADEYLVEPAKAAAERTGGVEQRVDGVIEVATMFAMTAVLADRERRREDEEHQTRVKRSREEKASGDDPAA